MNPILALMFAAYGAGILTGGAAMIVAAYIAYCRVSSP